MNAHMFVYDQKYLGGLKGLITEFALIISRISIFYLK